MREVKNTINYPATLDLGIILQTFKSLNGEFQYFNSKIKMGFNINLVTSYQTRKGNVFKVVCSLLIAFQHVNERNFSVLQ